MVWCNTTQQAQSPLPVPNRNQRQKILLLCLVLRMVVATCGRASTCLTTRVTKKSIMAFQHPPAVRHLFNFLQGYASASRTPLSFRLFSTSSSSSKSGEEFVKPTDIVGRISILNEQTSLLNMDIDRFRTTLNAIRHCIGYESYGVTLILVDDDEMTQINRESRSINAPTDILSFPFHPAISPGTLEPLKPPFDQIPDYYMLGDLIVDVPYVQRGCRDDEQDSQELQDEGDDDTEEYEEDDEEEEERGVSGAMASVFNPEERIHMLLVHGMLHLVGYDHETDEDYELMVTKEEEILKELGLPTRKDMER